MLQGKPRSYPQNSSSSRLGSDSKLRITTAAYRWTVRKSQFLVVVVVDRYISQTGRRSTVRERRPINPIVMCTRLTFSWRSFVFSNLQIRKDPQLRQSIGDCCSQLYHYHANVCVFQNTSLFLKFESVFSNAGGTGTEAHSLCSSLSRMH